MKRAFAFFLALMIVLSLVACTSKTTEQTEESKSNTEITDANSSDIIIPENKADEPEVPINVDDDNSPSTASSDDSLQDLDAIGDIEVDKGLIDVTLHIPADFADADKGQADYDAMAKEKGYKSITLNDDGSLTYVMTKAQHEELMDSIDAEFKKQLNEMCESEDYPNFVSINANQDYTHFEIISKCQELDLSESFSVLAFYSLSGMYNIFNGTTVDNCSVTFINESSGAVISEANSADAGQS